MSHSNSSPKQNEDQRVLFTTVAGREGDVADCVLRYSQMEAGAAHIFAGKQSSLAACNIPHASLASFCKELAQLGASIYLELKNPYHQRMFVYKDMRIDAAYLFDPCADVFYRPDKEKGIVRVTQSEMSLCYYIVEPDTLCLFGSGVFSSFEHYLPRNSGYPEYPWEQTGHEWDFYTTILRFSASIDMKHNWSPRHSVEIIDWLSKPFLEAVAPVDNARAPLPSTEEILRRLHAPSTTQEKKAEVKTGEKSSVPHAQAMKMVETQKKSGKSNARNAVQIIADRLKDDMFVIPVETLFCLGGFGYTLNNQNCVFYHLASVQEDKAWMNMKSKWRKDLFNCVVMTNQSDDWARKVSKRLNKQLHDRRIIFLRPVKIDGSVDLSALDPEQPKVIARWYAPLEKKYYQCVIKWDGYSHDGSEDYYSLMLYAAE